MNKTIFILIAFLIVSCEFMNQEKNNDTSENEIIQTTLIDFDESNIGQNSAEDVAIGVIDFLKNADTTRYLDLAIPLEALKYLHQQNFVVH